MTPVDTLHNALMDGVSIAPDGIGNIKLIGDEESVSKWLPMVRKNKVAILAILSPRRDYIYPAPCRVVPPRNYRDSR